MQLFHFMFFEERFEGHFLLDLFHFILIYIILQYIQVHILRIDKYVTYFSHDITIKLLLLLVMLDPSKRPTFKVKNPNGVAITNFLIGNFLCRLKQSDTNNCLLFFLNLPTMKNTIHSKVNKQIPNIKSFQYFHIKKRCTIKRNICINIFLIVITGLKRKQ